MSTRRINFWATLVVLMGVVALRGGGSEVAAQCLEPENYYIADVNCSTVPYWVYQTCENCEHRSVACVELPTGGVIVSCEWET